MRVVQSESRLLERLKKRVPYAMAGVFLLFLLLLFRLWYLQIVKGDELKARSENNRIRVIPVKPFRGKIFDRNGVEIVSNRPSFNLSLIPEDVKDVAALLDTLQGKFDLEKERILKAVKSVYLPFQKISMKKDLSRDEVAFIEEHKLDFPGVVLDIEPLRSYRYRSTASHMLGYIGEISRKQMLDPNFSGYLPGESIGKYGLEKNYESFLKGKTGKKWIEVDAEGRRIGTLNEKDSVAGNNLILSIDIALQREAEKQFKGKSGALSVIDLSDGSVLAFVNSPGFDPNMFAKGITGKQWKALMDDPLKPLQNRAIHGQYPPGSVHKVITALAALEEGVIEKETEIDCPGYFRLGKRVYRCWKKSGHGKVSLRKALSESCDVFFYSVGMKLGIDKLAVYAKKFGLGEQTHIELEGEKKGIVPSSEWKKRVKGEDWIAGETASCAIGQGFNLVTPMQSTVMMGAIATNGTLWKPSLVKKVVSSKGETIKTVMPSAKKRVEISSEHFQLIKDALYDVVNSESGTGKRASVKDVDVVGKTGTSQVIGLKRSDENSDEEEEVPYQYRDHAWFSGYAPAYDPKIAFSILVEHGGHGGAAAAPIAREIIEKYMETRPEVLKNYKQIRPETGVDTL
ncbi:MAG: penicillin-binding protein 2 [Nitrospinota bacterium]